MSDDTNLLEQVWQQFCCRPVRSDPTITMDGGLSVLEDVAEVLHARGRLVPVAEHPEKEWWRVESSPRCVVCGNPTEGRHPLYCRTGCADKATRRDDGQGFREVDRG